MRKTEYTRVYRILHWSIAISFTLLLMTIFLRMTWLNKNNVADIIQEFLQSVDLTISDDDAVKLAKKIRKPMWMWHIYIGYVLVGLFIIRSILPFFGIMKFHNPFTKNLTRKEKFRNWTYFLFYVFTIITLITGLALVIIPREEAYKDLKHTMEALHKPSIYYIVAFVIIHLVGIFIAEFTDEKGIISKIISGNKNEIGIDNKKENQ